MMPRAFVTLEVLEGEVSYSSCYVVVVKSESCLFVSRASPVQPAVISIIATSRVRVGSTPWRLIRLIAKSIY